MSFVAEIKEKEIKWENGDTFVANHPLPKVDNLDEIFEQVSGTFTWTDGDVYEGDYKNGEPHGNGRFTWSCGDCYEGIWTKGYRNVFGIQKYNYGTYTGEWRNDKLDGDGCMEYFNGDVCAGEFENDNFNDPNGFFRYANGDEYKGSFKNWKFNGQGTFTYADGRKYEGEWKNGKKHGYGVYYWVDGDIYKGYWMNGKRHGEGIKIKNGMEECVQFKNGRKL